MYISAVYPLIMYISELISVQWKRVSHIFRPPLGAWELTLPPPASAPCLPHSRLCRLGICRCDHFPSGGTASCAACFAAFRASRFAFSLARNFCASSSVRKAAWPERFSIKIFLVCLKSGPFMPSAEAKFAKRISHWNRSPLLPESASG